MRKNSSKLDKLPQPLTISKKLNLKKLEETNPYRIGEEIKENRLSTSRRHSGLAQMKQQLLQIKDDMIKLFTPSSEDPVNVENPPDILHQALKQELLQQKQSQEKLKRQIEKIKAQHSKFIQQIQRIKDSKIDQLKRDVESIKLKYDKMIEAKNRQITELKQQITKAQAQYKNLLCLQKSKYDLLSIQLNSRQIIIRNLKLGGLKQQEVIIQGVEVKKMNSELFIQLQSTNIELQNYKTMNHRLQEEIRQSQMRYFQARNSIIALEDNQISLLERLKQAEEQGQSNLEVNSQQLNTQRMEIINLQLTINDLQEQNYVLTEHNKYIKSILSQTDQYIKALQSELSSYITVSKSQYKKNKRQL